MLRSWKIGSAFGIPVYVHATFLLIPVYAISQAFAGGGGPVAAAFLVAWMLSVFGCVILHEFGHALMARYFGIGTRDITIYPIGGVARLEGMSEQPLEEFLIAIAGPAVNVVIAGLLTPIVLYAALTGALTGDLLNIRLSGGIWPIMAQFASALWFANIVLVLFNMVPAFPMDGGRVFRALLTIGLGFPRATEVAVRVGSVVAVLLGVLGVYFLHMYMLPIVLIFVLLAGQAELQAIRRREAYKLAQSRMAALNSPLSLPIHEVPPVGPAIEIHVPAPVALRAPAEPPLLFHFRVLEVPESPRG